MRFFTNERGAGAGCVFNPAPEDNASEATTGSDVVNFANFMRMSAPPMPVTSTTSQVNGQKIFGTVGCALCHSPSLTTSDARYSGMGKVTYSPYSDFAIHHMGSTLADGVNQGDAGADEFRSAPLWGLGQRLFFLHDGRTSDLMAAIRAHSSPGLGCVTNTRNQVMTVNGRAFLPASNSLTCGSEANTVIQKFEALKAADKQDLLNFLRSL